MRRQGLLLFSPCSPMDHDGHGPELELELDLELDLPFGVHSGEGFLFSGLAAKELPFFRLRYGRFFAHFSSLSSTSL